MITQPITNEETIKLPEITFSLVHAKNETYPTDPILDQSHIHDYYEIYLNISGDVSFLVNNHLYPVECGDIIFSRPGDVHVCVINKPCMHEHFCLWLTNKCGAELFSQDITQNRISLSKANYEQIYKSLISMNNGSLGNIDNVKNIIDIVHLINNEQGHEPSQIIIPEEMQKILNYVNKNFLTINKVSDICHIFSISSATLDRWFKKYISLSPIEFIKSKKIAYAKQLLDSGDTVTEACMKSGFSDCSYFINVFKSKFGITPLKYKQNK